MMKQAYEIFYDGDYGYPDRREIEVLPKCKKVTKFGNTDEYQLVRRKVFFGLIPWTYWLNKRRIEWHDPPTVECYDYSCGDE